MGLPLTPEQISQIEKGIETMNMLLESMEIKRDGKVVTIKMVFKDEMMAKAYVESMKVIYQQSQGE